MLLSKIHLTCCASTGCSQLESALMVLSFYCPSVDGSRVTFTRAGTCQCPRPMPFNLPDSNPDVPKYRMVSMPDFGTSLSSKCSQFSIMAERSVLYKSPIGTTCRDNSDKNTKLRNARSTQIYSLAQTEVSIVERIVTLQRTW